MDKFTYNSLVNSTSTLQRRFDLICKVLNINKSSNSVEEINKEISTSTTNNVTSNPTTSSIITGNSVEDDPMSLIFQDIIKLTSPSPSVSDNQKQM
jgi:hypothetical protein